MSSCVVVCLHIYMQGVSELSRLTSLTDLTLHALNLSDEQLGSTAACTGLVEISLDVWPRRIVDAAGLMELTSLTRLTQLTLHGGPETDEMCSTRMLVSWQSTTM